MNSEARFARSRIRGLMPALEAAGLSPVAHRRRRRPSGARPRGAGTGDRGGAGAGGKARTAAACCWIAKALMAAPREVGLRALAALLMAVSGEPTGPGSRRWSGFSTASRREIWAGAPPCMAAAYFRHPAPARLLGPKTLDSVPGKFQAAKSPVNRPGRPALRKRLETLNVLLAGNGLETPYLISSAGASARMQGVGLGRHGPWG